LPGHRTRNRRFAQESSAGAFLVTQPSIPPPDGGERSVGLCFDDPFPNYDTEPVMAYLNNPDFAA